MSEMDRLFCHFYFGNLLNNQILTLTLTLSVDAMVVAGSIYLLNKPVLTFPSAAAVGCAPNILSF